MFGTLELPIWFVVVAALLAIIAAFERMLIPSVRWFLRRRMERVVARVNTRLQRPIEPFKLARRHDTIQRIIYHPEVMSAVAEFARKEGIPENVAFERARKYAREIVPSFSASAYFGIATRLSKILSRALYRVRLGHDDETLKDIDPNATVVFVMNHRSNMDYVLVTYLAAERSALSYAVGEWARVWPLSRLLQAMGAYFIRRRSRGALYRRVLSRYVQLATEEGVTQAIFPEGGLSLNGKLAEPKLGLLNYAVSAWEQGGRDLVFVPVAVNYDRVLEDYILVAAEKRGDRRFGANISVVVKFLFNQLWLRVTGRFYRFGYAAASFGQPLSLNEFQKGKQKFDIEKVAGELMNRIGKVVPILPVPLIALVLEEAAGDIAEADLIEQAKTLLGGFKEGHVHLPRESADYAIEVGLRNLASRKLIDRTNGLVSITQKGEDVVPYYAATISHLKRKG